MTARLEQMRTRADAGFTLVELLVAITLFAMVSGVLMTTLTSTSKAVTVSKSTNGINEEARLTLNRIARELREARTVTAVGFTPCGGSGQVACPTGTTGSVATSLTFDDDFNGNGAIDGGATDPETLTYCYDVANKRILLTPHLPASTDCADPDALPVLTTDVESFTLDFRSSLYQYDANADGVTTWQELDNAVLTAGVGNRNGTLDPFELRNIDSVSVSITVFKGQRRQTYRTQVNLRNRP
jgi:prepilin-type N-terminal cleavage/methylation domain-containing protein